MTNPPRPLHFAAFVMNPTGHIIQGTWRRPTAHQAFGRGDRLPERHPAARYRGAFAPTPA
jgi:hypothetical protein